MINFLKKLFGEDNNSRIDTMTPRIQKINDFEVIMRTLTDLELAAKTQEFKNRIKDGETLDGILPEAFAVVREAGRRVTGMRHFDVQLIGGMVLHGGNVAEMRTGEGKTYVATLPAYLNALSGLGVHVVTVNDYLAKRDTQLMGQLYHFLGLTVSVVNSQDQNYQFDPSVISNEEDQELHEEGEFKIIEEFLKPVTRKEAYACDITYGTNSEFGFDYLRDNTQYSIDRLVQRGHNFVIVDEADSILIDEARVPLILSTITKLCPR